MTCVEKASIMQEYVVAFAGLNVTVRYEQVDAGLFLRALFADLHIEISGNPGKIIGIMKDSAPCDYILVEAGQVRFKGPLNVAFAAALFDLVIFNLLDCNRYGVALHAGAVARGGKVVLLPGQSGAGKSTITAWLTAHGCTYLTDELVLLPENDPPQTLSFTRPLCLKQGSKAVVKAFLPIEALEGALEDADGMIVPHRSVNPRYVPVSGPPALILFPVYQPAAALRVEAVPKAQAITLLMSCDVNGRNLASHGFRQLVRLVRSAPGLSGSLSVRSRDWRRHWRTFCVKTSSWS